MKILFSSRSFYPNIGGLETVSALLAHEFVCLGHEVRLITETPSQKSEFPFEIIRRPNPKQLLRLVRWCDVFFHNNISLFAAWPLLLVRKPWVIAHHTWLSASWKGRLKRFVLRFATHISISQALADHISIRSTIIGNPYDNQLFFEMPGVKRERDLIFVGRLISDKGIRLILEALDLLKDQNLELNLTIVGSGPEETNLRQMVIDRKLSEQVNFAGSKRGKELAALLNEHKLMVVPSLWPEPSGIVALEGIACGCVVVGSEGGGLAEAIGPGGLTFPNGDSAALTQRLTELFSKPEVLSTYRTKACAHLAKHTRQAVAEAYLAVFQKALL